MRRGTLAATICFLGSLVPVASSNSIALLCTGRIDHATWVNKGKKYGGSTSNFRDLLVALDLSQKLLIIGPQYENARAKGIPIIYADEFRIDAEVPLVDDDGERIGLKTIKLNRVTGEMTFRDEGEWRAFSVLRASLPPV
jgi:hypothetical protein